MMHKLRLFIKKILPFKLYLKIEYFASFKRFPNLSNPQLFSEKIYCLKFLNKKKEQLLQECYDKYNVRDYIREKEIYINYPSILNEVYGVYSDAKEINFDELPNKFVLKITQSSGYNIICIDKNKLDIEATIEKLNDWKQYVNQHPSDFDEEYCFDGNARIICEKLLVDKKGNLPREYRIYCFNGTPKLIGNEIGTTNIDGSHGLNLIRNVYDTEWNLLKLDLGRPHDERYIEDKPCNLTNILEIATVLSQDFEFVRVDLYDVDRRIFFGELTWIPMGGNCRIKPERYDKILGDWLVI